MSGSEMIGWDLLLKLIEKDLKVETDMIVAITHWYLISQAGFRCLGNGDEKALKENEENNSSEALPDKWSENSTSYSLRYFHENRVYILLGTVTNDTIILNLLNGATLQVANTALNVKDTVKTMQGNLATIVPEIQVVLGRLRRELLEPVLVVEDANKKTSETQTEAAPCPQQPNPGIPDLEYGTPDVLRSVPPRRFDPLRDIGRGDLDPLGRGGGGMIFDPFSPNPTPPIPLGPDRRPLPGVIPGARFDPFGPLDPGRITRSGPSNDHFPPPGYDDMFL